MKNSKPDLSENLVQKLYVVVDKVKNLPDFATLNFNDSDFVRCNLPIIHSRFQMKDVVVYNLGRIDHILDGFQNAHTVDFAAYKFETESQNLVRLGMKQDEIEAYFAEKSKKNRGMTEKQIISFMENYISQYNTKEE